jgi:two-component system, OmpR family, sensor kinase
VLPVQVTLVRDRLTREWAATPLRRRLVLGLLTVMSVTLIVVAAATFFGVRTWMVERIDASLMAGKDSVISGAGDGDGDNRGGKQQTDAFQPWTINGASLYRVNADGTASALVSSGYEAPSSSVSDTAALSSVPVGRDVEPVTISLDALGTSRAVAVPVVVTDLRLGTITDRYTAVAVIPMSRATEVAGRLLLVELVAMGLALLFAGLAAAWFIRRSMRPLQDVAETARAVAELPLEHGDVTIPARVPSPVPTTEVGQVGLAVNAMLDHVEASLQTRADTEDRLRRFVSDAGHELRTPLAAVRGYAELMRRGASADPEQSRHAAERIEAAGSRMGMLVEDLLLLASLDEQRPLAQDAVDLQALLHEAVAEAATAGPDHDWSIDGSDDPVVIVGDGVRLHQAVGNLLANARAHTPVGTSVTASVTEDGAWAHVEVRDDGPGFPVELLPRVTERFARGDASRSRATGGSGLGLSIVKAVTEAHGGTISVANRTDARGAVIRLSLPVAGPNPDSDSDSDAYAADEADAGIRVEPAVDPDLGFMPPPAAGDRVGASGSSAPVS